jgi:hypothetical protein
VRAATGHDNGDVQQQGHAMQNTVATISETSIFLRYANDSDPDNATEWFELEIPLEDLQQPEGANVLNLVDAKRAALRRLQGSLAEELQRLSGLVGR